jgi:hypothetical protein
LGWNCSRATTPHLPKLISYGEWNGMKLKMEVNAEDGAFCPFNHENWANKTLHNQTEKKTHLGKRPLMG